MANEETIVRYTYRLEPGESGPCAECIELDLAAEGTTPEEAVEALRQALYHRLLFTTPSPHLRFPDDIGSSWWKPILLPARRG